MKTLSDVLYCTVCVAVKYSPFAERLCLLSSVCFPAAPCTKDSAIQCVQIGHDPCRTSLGDCHRNSLMNKSVMAVRWDGVLARIMLLRL